MSDTPEAQGPTTEETPPPPPTFDQFIAERMAMTIDEILNTVPELRGVACAFDFVGDLNDANICKGLWLARGMNGKVGNAETPDAVFGGLFQTLSLIEQQFMQAWKLCNIFRESNAQLGQGIIEANEELKRIEGLIAARTQEAAVLEQAIQEKQAASSS